MKKSTFFTGVISTILLLIGILFKTQHWPLSGVFMTVSLASFALGYAVLLFMDKSKSAQTGIDKFANVMVLLTMIIVSISFLFKIMHWPGAGYGIYAAHIILIAMIVVLYIQGSKQTDPVKKLHIDSSAIVLTLMTAISIYIWWRTSVPQA
jgi:ABC-type multidrug transport system fused ATPase/permease subunit